LAISYWLRIEVRYWHSMPAKHDWSLASWPWHWPWPRPWPF